MQPAYLNICQACHDVAHASIMQRSWRWHSSYPHLQHTAGQPLLTSWPPVPSFPAPPSPTSDSLLQDPFTHLSLDIPPREQLIPLPILPRPGGGGGGAGASAAAAGGSKAQAPITKGGIKLYGAAAASAAAAAARVGGWAGGWVGGVGEAGGWTLGALP